MSLQDRGGYELSTASPAAARSYNEGLERLLAGRPGARECFEAAIEADPALAVAHVALAGSLASGGHGGAARRARESASELAAAGVLTRREAGQVRVSELLARTGASALGEARRHLVAFPKDVFVLGQTINTLFFHGGPGRKAAVLELLSEMAPHYPNDWWFDSRHAFHLLEREGPDRARDVAARAVAANPDNAYAVHSMAHVLHADGDFETAYELVDGWLRQHPEGGGMTGHLQWHLAGIDLRDGRIGRARERYEQHVRPACNPGPWHLKLADAAGFLWKADVLDDAGCSEGWREVSAFAQQVWKGPGRPFVDVHAAFAFAGAGDGEPLEDLRSGLAQPGESSFSRVVTLSVVRGITAFADRDYGAAVEHLQALEEGQLEGLGGSDVERGLVTETLVEARRRGA